MPPAPTQPASSLLFHGWIAWAFALVCLPMAAYGVFLALFGSPGLLVASATTGFASALVALACAIRANRQGRRAGPLFVSSLFVLVPHGLAAGMLVLGFVAGLGR